MMPLMKSYQLLAVIAGVLGMIIVFLAYAVFSFANIMVKSFGGITASGEEIVSTLVTISAILYIITIIIPFVLKRTKPLGIALLILAFATLISASYFGVISMALLVAAGIAALRQKEITSRTAGVSDN